MKKIYTVTLGILLTGVLSAYAATPVTPTGMTIAPEKIITTTSKKPTTETELSDSLKKAVATGKITEEMADSITRKTPPPAPKHIGIPPEEVKVTKEAAAASLKPKSVEETFKQSVSSGKMTQAQADLLLKKIKMTTPPKTTVSTSTKPKAKAVPSTTLPPQKVIR